MHPHEFGVHNIGFWVECARDEAETDAGGVHLMFGTPARRNLAKRPGCKRFSYWHSGFRLVPIESMALTMFSN